MLNTSKTNSDRAWLGQIIAITTVFGTVLGIAVAIKAKQIGLFESDAAMASFINGLGPLAPIVFVIYQLIQTVVPIIPGGVSVPAGFVAFGWFWGLILSYFPCLIGSLINFWLAKKYGWKIIRAMAAEGVLTIWVVIVTLALNVGLAWLMFQTPKAVLIVFSLTALLFGAWWWQKRRRDTPSEDNYQQAKNWFKKLTTKHHLGDWLPVKGRLASRHFNLESIVALTMTMPFFPADLLTYVFGLTELKFRRLAQILSWAKAINILLYGLLIGELGKWIFRLF